MLPGNKNEKSQTHNSHGSFRPIFNYVFVYISSDWCISVYPCVPFYYLCVCQWCAPAVYLPFSQWPPDVGANFSVEFSPPDPRGESSRRSWSRGNASGVNQFDWEFYDFSFFMQIWCGKKSICKIDMDRNISLLSVSLTDGRWLWRPQRRTSECWRSWQWECRRRWD